MKKYNGKEYVQVPEEERDTCVGCVAHETSDFELCKAIRDKRYCQSNRGMIYKEKGDVKSG